MSASPTSSSTPPPPDRVRVRRALLSVSDKSGLVELGRALVQSGIELVSTGGTARALRDAGLAVRSVDELTGFPEIMDGRVKTLHPRVHGGLLGRRDLPEHVKAMEQHGIESIDLLVVDLYPFERTVARADCTDDEAIEQIDIGGPAMIRSAAKNHAFVAVVTSPIQYEEVLTTLARRDGSTTLDLRRRLAAAAFARTAAYDSTIAGWMGSRLVASRGGTGDGRSETPDGGAGGEVPSGIAGARQVSWSFRPLRYGENPHQDAAVAATESGDRTSVASAVPLHGKELSYNNLLDAAAALEAVQDLVATFGGEPAAAIVKHTNPCGAALGSTLARAFDAAYSGDPLAAYGGILALSADVDEETATRIVEGEKFFEVIVAPSFSPAALERLGLRWKNVRLLPVGPIGAPVAELMVRSIPGGALAQRRDTSRPQPDRWTRAAGPAPDAALQRSAAFAVVLVKHLKSNAVCIVRGTTLLGAGAGQMDRVASCRIAVEKAGDRLRAPSDGGPVAVAASDAFFPFADGPQALIDAGVGCLVHPGGSKRDADTVALCEARGVTCLVTGVRGFRH